MARHLGAVVVEDHESRAGRALVDGSDEVSHISLPIIGRDPIVVPAPATQRSGARPAPDRADSPAPPAPPGVWPAGAGPRAATSPATAATRRPKASRTPP